VSLDSLILNEVRALSERVAALTRGHNALVEILRHQGRVMSALSDAIKAEDAKAVQLIELVGNLINKINNGQSQLDPEAQAALQALDDHLNQVTAEATQADEPAPAPQPFSEPQEPPAGEPAS